MANSVQAENNCLNTPGLAIHGSASALVKIANTTFFKVNGRSMYIAAADAPSLALATRPGPITGGVGAGALPTIVGNQLSFGGGIGPVAGSLDFDNGSQPVSTNSCRIYTLCADSLPTEAGTVSLYWLAGNAFPKHRQSQESDIAHTPLPTSVELGYVYIKNETSAVFVPGTTALDTASLTVTYTNNFGIPGK